MLDLQTGNATRASLMIFMTCIVGVLVGTITSVREIVKEDAVYRRERMVGLKVMPYIASKVLIGFVFALYSGIVLFILKIAAVDFSGLPAAALAQLFMATTLGTFAGVMWGLFVSAVAPSEDRAMLLVILVLVPQFMFSGAMVPLADLGWVGKIVGSITSTRWQFGAMVTSAQIESGPRLSPDLSDTYMPGIEKLSNPIEKHSLILLAPRPVRRDLPRQPDPVPGHGVLHLRRSHGGNRDPPEAKGHPVVADLVGKTLGRYTVTALIGQGGMATVYRAHDPVLDREVAIKVMHGHLAADPAFVGRFQHEAQAVAALSHPNIVKVFDFGTEVDSYYMVMELIDGSTLANLLTERAAAASPGRGAALSSKEILRIFPPLCSAVDYAGARGMVHRDIKPANVLLTAQGDPVLTDYGIAKLMGATSYTVAGMVMGSAHYMSPEQVQGFPTDVRSDIYSLGVCLFEALAGRVPYDAETTASILAQHLSAPIPPAQRLNPNLPADIQAVVDKVLAKEPENRFQKATALATALQTILSLPGTSTTGTRPVQNLAATVIVQGAPQGARAYTPTGSDPDPDPTGIPTDPTGTPS